MSADSSTGRRSPADDRSSPNWYERHLLPYLMDFACGLSPVRRQRAKVVPLAQGDVLEIGIGTGRNLEYYVAGRVRSIVGLDPGTEMHGIARRRIVKSGLPVQLVGVSARRIPFEAGAFDTVVVTYSLCSMQDPGAALAEMRRVLRPGGRLLFCEHGLAPDASVRRWQERLNPVWSHLAGGCRLDRDVPALLQAAGFRSPDMERGYLPGPKPLTYNYWGTAVVNSEQ